VREEAASSPRFGIVLAVIAALAFFASLYLASRGEGQKSGGDKVGPSTFSTSAIGLAGFAEILRTLGVPVVKSEYASATRLGPGGVLVLVAPPALPSVLGGLGDAGTTLLVLPKRQGQPNEQRPDWLGSVSLVPEGVAGVVLGFAVPRAQVTRTDERSDWMVNELAVAPTVPAPVQLIDSDQLRPVVASDDGILVGAVEHNGKRLWVLSDPDVLANFAIGEGENAAFAVALIDAMRGADGRVVFDETVHGFVARPASPLRLLVTFPYSLVTVQGLLAVALLLWAMVPRFGAPAAAPPALSAGKMTLIENAARLLEFAGHQLPIVGRYVQAILRDVAQELHAPRGLSGASLIEWLRQIGSAREVAIDCAALDERAASAAQGRRGVTDLVLLARDAYRWKQEILDGAAGHSRRR